MFDLSKLDEKSTKSFVDLALTGLTIIARLIGGATAAQAVGIFAAIKAVTDALVGVLEGKVSSERVREDFAKLAADLESNDQRADEALKAKFPK